jgi:hypothetical protein
MAQHDAAHLFRQRLHAFLKRIALIGEGEFRPVLMAGFRDAPGNRHLVGKAHDEPALAGHDVAALCFQSHVLRSPWLSPGHRNSG